jgi:hypothetical protein
LFTNHDHRWEKYRESFNNDLTRLCTSSIKRTALVPGMKLEFETFCCNDSEATAVLVDNLFLNSGPTFLDFNSDNSWTCGTYRTEAIKPTYSSMRSKQICIQGIAYPQILRRSSGRSVGKKCKLLLGFEGEGFPKIKSCICIPNRVCWQWRGDIGGHDTIWSVDEPVKFVPE